MRSVPNRWNRRSHEGRALFSPGVVASTPGAPETFSREFITECLCRHLRGDWGTVDESDKRADDFDVNDEERSLSAYEQDGNRLWIIREADRSSTCVLLPQKY